MNIANILKDCPKGTPLYCTVFGECSLEGVNPVEGTNDGKLISVWFEKEHPHAYAGYQYFFEDGRLEMNGECVLFPSKENRDWSTFKASKRQCSFKPFEQVIARLNDSPKGTKGVWSPAIFSRPSGNEKYPFFVIGGCSSASECLPYNERTAKLIGTTDDYTEEDLS